MNIATCKVHSAIQPFLHMQLWT